MNLPAAASAAATALKQGGYLLGIAESCTGGLIAAELSEIAGASQWFSFGIVAYTNNAKKSLLYVPEQTLTKHGAVSEETAAKMCAGALKLKANCALSVTGIAGPSGGTAKKPVGMVCFGWQLAYLSPQTDTQYFSGKRRGIRQKAAIHALSGLLPSCRRTDV